MQLIILGMHRSGTSSVAGFFQHTGVYFGPSEQAFDLHRTNQKGFFERKDVVRINDRILESTGASWITPERFPRSVPVSFDRHELYREASAIVSELSTQRDWFVKDPRMCVTLPFWKKLFSDPVYLLVLRNPLNVAKSLAKRGDCSIPTGLALWERYTRDMFHHTKDSKRLIVSFESIMADPFVEMSRLIKDLAVLTGHALKMPGDVLQSWFDRNLVHHEAKENELAEYATTAMLNLYRDVTEAKEQSRAVTETITRSSHHLLLELEQFCHDRAENLERLKAWRNRLALITTSEHIRSKQLRKEVEALLQSGRWKVASSVFDALGRPISKEEHGYDPDGIRHDIDTSVALLAREANLAAHPSLLFPHQRYPQENPEIRTNPSSLRILVVSPNETGCRTAIWMQEATRVLTSFGHEVNWLSIGESRQHLIHAIGWPAFDYLINPDREDMIRHVLNLHDAVLCGPDTSAPLEVQCVATEVKKPWITFSREPLDIRYGAFYPRSDFPRYDVGVLLRDGLLSSGVYESIQQNVTAWKPNARFAGFIIDHLPTDETMEAYQQLGWDVIVVGRDPAQAVRMAGMCEMHLTFDAMDAVWISAAGIPVGVLDPSAIGYADAIRSFLTNPAGMSGQHALDAMSQRHALSKRWQEVILALNDLITAKPLT
jgi:hypothetical protein